MRVGIGYDVHPLIEGRRLVLGGVEVPFERGLGGHSDADVLSHAVMDALLGAAALGDIGVHFPPEDPRFRGISSLELLRDVAKKLAQAGWQVVNVDSTIVAQHPKLAPFIPEMQRLLSQSLGTDEGQITIKATTTEGLGFAGREEGIAAYAVALIDSSLGTKQ